MKIFFEVEGDVDCSDSEEETSFVLFHDLNEWSVPFNKPEDELQGNNSSSSEVGLRVLSLEAESHPFLAGLLRGLLEVFSIETVEEIPTLLI